LELIELSRLSLAIAEVEKHYELDRDYRRFEDFMLDCLALVEARLPQVASAAVATAKNYFSGRATEEDLEQARVRCWNHLEAHGYGSEIQEPEAIGIRSAICALYARPVVDDAVELLEWFLSLVNQLDDRSEEQVELLAKHFPAAT
jgi:hypothetical protein